MGARDSIDDDATPDVNSMMNLFGFGGVDCSRTARPGLTSWW